MNSELSFDNLRNSSIGTVESISAHKIEVLLENDAPQSTSITTGIPTPFPRINTFILIPNESGALVGLISWLGTKPANYPKRKGYKDFDLIDLPFPLRKMVITPLGTLKRESTSYIFNRGVYSFPSIGDIVIVPTIDQLAAIVENRDPNAQIQIGVTPIAGNAPVFINPNKLFGRHCAVLGNTGSGKSCTVAGLIRWSVLAVRENRKDKLDKGDPINARFIIMDPNGEYDKAFDDLGTKIRKYRVKLNSDQESIENQLAVPAWMWNSSEWASITQASQRAQLPILKQALREARAGAQSQDDDRTKIKRYLEYLIIGIRQYVDQFGNISQWKQIQDVNRLLSLAQQDLSIFQTDQEVLDTVRTQIVVLLDHNTGDALDGYSVAQLETLATTCETALVALGGEVRTKLPSEDVPRYFAIETIISHLRQQRFSGDVGRYLDYFISRIETLFTDTRIEPVIRTRTEENLNLRTWLEGYIGGNKGQNGEIAILDLSLMPTELVHLIVAIIARLSFEAVQRYKRSNENADELPTVLVLEEAHNFIKKLSTDETPSAILCYAIFEKIAREGRKFGLGLLLSSQRPYELSPTVLSQCNTFVLHRIVNDQDQEMIKNLVPDSFSDMLAELPVLPTQQAILLGWATPIPLLVNVQTLEKHQQPTSQDPSFWDVWTGKLDRPIDWEKVVNRWYSEGGPAIGSLDVKDEDPEPPQPAATSTLTT